MASRQLPAEVSALAAADADASARFDETVELVRSRLKEISSTVSDRSSAEYERLQRISWATTMLLNTSEEALRARGGAARAAAQQAKARAKELEAAAAGAAASLKAAEADAAAKRKSLGEVEGKGRKAALEARQQRTRDATRLQELQSQVKQMASTHRLAEAAWQEERRADQAASTQREKNFQKAIVRLQRDLEAARAAYDAQAKSNGGGGGAAGSSSSPAGSSLEHSEWVPVQFASPPLASADAAALRRRVEELEERCAQGVQLIEMLKARLKAEGLKTAESSRRGSPDRTPTAGGGGGAAAPASAAVAITPCTCAGPSAAAASSSSPVDDARAVVERLSDQMSLAAERREEVAAARSAAEAEAAEARGECEGWRVRCLAAEARVEAARAEAAEAKARHAAEVAALTDARDRALERLEHAERAANAALAAASNGGGGGAARGAARAEAERERARAVDLEATLERTKATLVAERDALAKRLGDAERARAAMQVAVNDGKERLKQAQLTSTGAVQLLRASTAEAERKVAVAGGALAERTAELDAAKLQLAQLHAAAMSGGGGGGRSPGLTTPAMAPRPYSATPALMTAPPALAAPPTRGLKAQRASLLDTLREERVKLDRERALIRSGGGLYGAPRGS